MSHAAHHILACAVLLLAVSTRNAAAQHGPPRASELASCQPRDSMPVYRPDVRGITPMPRVGAPDRPPFDSALPPTPREPGRSGDSMPTLRPDTSDFRMPRLVPPAGERSAPRDSVVRARRDCPAR